MYTGRLNPSAAGEDLIFNWLSLVGRGLLKFFKKLSKKTWINEKLLIALGGGKGAS